MAVKPLPWCTASDCSVKKGSELDHVLISQGLLSSKEASGRLCRGACCGDSWDRLLQGAEQASERTHGEHGGCLAKTSGKGFGF